jgi:hypothetical protein
MSEQWPRVVLATFGIAALGILLSVPLRPHQRAYGGKSLEQWVSQLRSCDSGQAEIAISEIGPDAIPFLLRQVRSSHSRSVSVPAGLSRAAGNGTWTLPGAGSNDVRLAYRIMCSVRLMGPPAIPALLTALEDSDRAVRLEAVQTIGAISPEADLIFPVLTKLLDDPDPDIRDTAVTLLGRMRHRRSLVAPVLLQALKAEGVRPGSEGVQRVRAHIVAELGRIGTTAHSAVPELRTMFSGTDPGLRREAAVALCRIDGDTNALVFLLTELKQVRSATERLPILMSIHQMGPAARAAASPVLELVADSPGAASGADKELQDAARQLLRRIDPEKLAQLPGLH